MLFSSKKDKFEKYSDPLNEFSNRELKLGEWFLRHELKLKTIGKNTLIVFCVVTVGYSFGYWLYYFGYGYWQDQKMFVQQNLEFENYDNLKSFYRPQNIGFGQINVFNTVSEELYDFSVMVNNPNPRWLVGLTYKYIYSGGETPISKTVVLPGSQRPLTFLGLKTEGYPEGAKLVVLQTEWLKLDSHVLPDVTSFVQERSNFTLANFKYAPISRVNGTPANIITFLLKNNSAYGFWTADFYVVLLSGGEPVGTMYLSLDKFKAGETRPVDLRSFVPGLSVDEAVIYPLINIFDREVYLAV
ncbi:MAG: hypothetical protein US42_C0017G0009 [Candidatus Magasanikbacteria bacterium GW2011_GWC2_37_14]|uniref:Uncharacterized protein n=1 Tax=Candidatus Magasanikbacteria bacterium GW2011_GWC2_37_14 TaxID=1619046 RepID=A0A0G0G791_9BACT|nr:MAG: hypothetical protein US42_C0017G0009 [Candidatus Magasanikbacteria bacterium GW2011_GWC2_37_14]